MSFPIPPSITKGQLALDPVNGIVYYKDENNNTVATTWSWLQSLNQETNISSEKNVSIEQDLTVGGDLIIGGDTVSLNVSEVLIEDNILVLNYNFTGAPILNAGIEIERGSENNVQIRWNEAENKWQFTNDGTTFLDLNSIIENSVTLGLHTTGNYVKNLIAGTGVTISDPSGEGATPNISIGQPVATTDAVTFAGVTAPLTGNVTGNVTGNLTGNVTGNVTGNITGQASDITNHGINALNDVDATPSSGQFLKWNGTSWVNDAIDLTTDTVGDYTKNLVAGTGVTITNNSGEGSTPNISIGQPVATTDSVTFDEVYANLTGDVTGTVSDISNHGISDLSDVNINDPADGNFLRYNGSNWFNDPVNLATDTIGDYVSNLTGSNGITITNNSGENATPNIAFSGSIDNISDITITSAQNGQILEYDGAAWVNTVRPSSEPIGHENKADSVISFDESSRQFSIAPASTSYTVWCTGKRYVKTSTESVTIPDTSGLYYIYFNSSGSLAYKTTYFTWDQDTPTAYIYWNDVDNKAYFFADERHGVTLDWATHEYLHRTRGAAIANGFGVNNYTLVGDGSEDWHAQIDIANGTFFDEDLQVDIEHASSPTTNTWQQRLQSGAYIPVFYRLNNHWTKDVATQFPVKNGGTRAQFNLNTAGTWSSTAIDNNKYGVMFVVATNNLNEPIISIMGQSQYTDQGSAEASIWDELDLAGFPVVEFRPLYKIVFQTANAYANTPKTKFVNLLDLRQIISAGIGGAATAVSDHGLMTGLQDDDHDQYLLADGTRTAASLTVSGSITTNSLILDGIEIDAATPSDTNVLKYSSALNKYIPGVASTVASLDDLTDVIISAATPNQVLKYDGSNWVNANAPSGTTGSVYLATIGDGSTSTFVLTHGLSTRDLVVSFTQTEEPYGSFSTTWEATTLNTITVYFDEPPTSNSIRASVYGSVSGTSYPSLSGSMYSGYHGNDLDTEIEVYHGMGTRDVFVQVRNAASPYEIYDIAWESTTTNKLTLYFDLAPALDSVYVMVYAALSGVSSTSISGLTDVTLGGLANGDFLRYNGSVWINDPVNLSTDTVGDYVKNLVQGTGITITNNSGEGATPTISVTSSLDDLIDVSAATPVISQPLIWDGTNWQSGPFNQYLRLGENGVTDYVDLSAVSLNFNPMDGRYGDFSTDEVLIGNLDGFIARLSPSEVTINNTVYEAQLLPQELKWTNQSNGNQTKIQPIGATNGQVLAFNTGSSSYVPSDISIDSLSNVSAATPSNDEVLAWQSSTSQWISKTFSASVATLDAVGDVTAPAPSIGDVLQWNGSAWVNTTVTNISNSNISSSAAIDYSKLNLNNSVVNADVSSSAAIAYSKLSLSNSVDYTDLKDGPAKAGFRSTINAQTGTSYSLVLSDLAKMVTMDNASAMTLTVPTNASHGFAIGDRVDILRKGSGTLTVQGADGSVTVNATPGLKIRAQWSSATLLKLDTNTWVLIGDLQA